MNLASIHVSLADLTFRPWMAGVLIPIFAFVLIGVIVVTALYFQNRRRELWHQTARLALEKGQPLPAMAEDEATPRPRPNDTAENDLRAGLICLAAGFGLYLFLGSFLGRGLGLVGAIPGFVGVALLISGIVRLLLRKRNADRATQSTQP